MLYQNAKGFEGKPFKAFVFLWCGAHYSIVFQNFLLLLDTCAVTA